MAFPVPVADELKFGLMTRLPNPAEIRARVAGVEKAGLDSIWVGDHVAFTSPIQDPLVSLSFAAACSDKLTFGTSVYLLPLRHPTPVAKQVATLDQMTNGRLIFGVGVGGEFPREFEACGINVKERGGRLSEGIQIVKKLWSGTPVSHHGRFFEFEETHMQPAPVQPGGPPIWCGGRSKAALERAGHLCDGYISYVVTPQMYAEALDTIGQAREAAGRNGTTFGTAHLLFARVDKDYDTALDVAAHHLSIRYAMDFRKAAQRYAALGSGADVAAAINKFIEAGARYIVVDLIGPEEEKLDHLARFAAETVPLLSRKP
jgi:probable F420-dependent oxidoreductase